MTDTDPMQRKFAPPIGWSTDRQNLPNLVQRFQRIDGRLFAIVGNITPINGLVLWAYDLWRARSIQTNTACHVGGTVSFHRNGAWSKADAAKVEQVLAELWWETADRFDGAAYPDTVGETVQWCKVVVA